MHRPNLRPHSVHGSARTDSAAFDPKQTPSTAEFHQQRGRDHAEPSTRLADIGPIAVDFFLTQAHKIWYGNTRGSASASFAEHELFNLQDAYAQVRQSSCR